MINYETEGQRAYRVWREAAERQAPPCQGEGCQRGLLQGGYEVMHTAKGWKLTRRHAKGTLCRLCAEQAAVRMNNNARDTERLMSSEVRHIPISARIDAGANGLLSDEGS